MSMVLLNNNFLLVKNYRGIRSASEVLLMLSPGKDLSDSSCWDKRDGQGVCVSLPAGPDQGRRNQTCLRV